MRFLDFKQKLEGFVVFSLDDIGAFDPNFNMVQLSQWQKKNYIRKIIKGKYIFSDSDLNEKHLFLISNELLSPSYISLETALSWYGIIPEGVYTITAVSPIRTMDYQVSIGNFSYNKIKKSAFFGDVVNEIPGTKRKYRIASIEKAIIDYLYYHKEIVSSDDIDALRFNSTVIKNGLDFNLFISYAKVIENAELLKRANIFVKYFENA